MDNYLLVERSGALARYHGPTTLWEVMKQKAQKELPATRIAFFSDIPEWVPKSLEKNCFSKRAPGGANKLARALCEVWAKVVARERPALITVMLSSAPQDPDLTHRQIRQIISSDQLPDSVQATLRLIQVGTEPHLARFLKVLDPKVIVETA